MIEEVTELAGDTSTRTLAPTEATDTASEGASAEKPKRRRVTKKSADAELPLEGVETDASAEAKPKRAPRKKKTDEAAPAKVEPTNADEAAPAKPKRVTRAKKVAEPTDEVQNPAPVEQTASNAPASFQVAPAVAMGSFTPAPAAPVEREENREVSTRARRTHRDDDVATAPGNEAPSNGESSAPAENNENANTENRGENADDDDFRNSRLSYRDRRAMRREQRIVSRSGREEGETVTGETNGEARAPRPREERDDRPNNRDNDNRDNRGERSNRDNNNRNDRNNRGDNRNDRNNRGDNRNNRNDNRNDRNNRNDREPREARELREPRDNRRERNGSRGREYDLPQLQEMDGEALMAVVAELNMEAAPGEKDALIYAILEAQAGAQNAILKKGILEILNDGKGFLRCENYYPSEGDVYVSQTQIKRFGLKTGDEVLGTARVPKENERYHGLLRVESINGLSIEESRGRLNFEKLTPIFPTERFSMETEPGNITARIIDLISPIGKGQRGLIVAPPKAGKTTLIKNIANSITENNPEVLLFVLLIDERPEEVTDLSRSVRGEVVASTFDEVPENHIRVSDIVMERAKRLVEMGHDVVVLMDSITRLSRASNLVVSPSGRTMSGGLDPAAMYKPKRHFGAARNIENGGSLTMLATVLVDTGSRMDDYIFEELKGTGNLDLVLDRDLFNQRIFPAIDINRSGTRRDDLLLNKEELAATFHLRRTLAALDNDKAVMLLIDRLKNTKSNADFMEVVAKSQRNQPA